MDLHHFGIIVTLVGFLCCLVWIVLDNKKFYEGLDKSPDPWYNKEAIKPIGQKKGSNLYA